MELEERQEPEPEEIPITLQPIRYQYPRIVTTPMVSDYVVWSSFSFSAMNCCCLGFLAYIFSIKSRDCKVTGDLEGAAAHAKTAKYMNIAAVTTCFISFIIISIIIITGGTIFISPFIITMDKQNMNNYRGK